MPPSLSPSAASHAACVVRAASYNRLVVYLQGSVHNPLDLERADAANASAAFILSPPPLFKRETVQEGVAGSRGGAPTTARPFGNNVMHNDSAVLLAAMSLRVAFPKLDVYAQVSLAGNLHRLGWVIGKNGHALSTSSLKCVPAQQQPSQHLHCLTHVWLAGTG